MKILSIFAVFMFIHTYSQVGIGNSNPDTNSILDLTNAEGKGIVLPLIDHAKTRAINNPTNGLLYYNQDSNCVSFYNQNSFSWKDVCGIEKANIDLNTVNASVVGYYDTKPEKLDETHYR